MINERIKELANNTRIGHLVDTWDYDEFAQLIIRECVHIAYNKMAIQKKDGIQPSVVCDAIKEHFGVK